MKMLVERIPVSTNLPFALPDMKLYARVDGDEDNASLTTMGWEAAAEVESFAQVALLRQTVRVTIFDAALGAGMALPIGPASNAESVSVQIDGVASTQFDFAPGNRPYLNWSTCIRGSTPARVVIEYEAGFGDDAEDLPEDLRLAILDQVALVFDGRGSTDRRDVARSQQLARIGARYRGVSL